MVNVFSSNGLKFVFPFMRTSSQLDCEYKLGLGEILRNEFMCGNSTFRFLFANVKVLEPSTGNFHTYDLHVP